MGYTEQKSREKMVQLEAEYYQLASQMRLLVSLPTSFIS